MSPDGQKKRAAADWKQSPPPVRAARSVKNFFRLSATFSRARLYTVQNGKTANNPLLKGI